MPKLEYKKGPAFTKPPSNSWTFPTQGTRITQGYTDSHHGIDVGIVEGTPIVAPQTGTVIRAGMDNTGYGNLVVIKTVEGLEVFLGHLSKFAVNVGDKVTQGTIIGYSGNTGNSTGPHLHYEVRQGSGRVNPFDLQYSGSKVNKQTRPTTQPQTPIIKSSKSVTPMSTRTSEQQPAEQSAGDRFRDFRSNVNSNVASVFNDQIASVLPKVSAENLIITVLGTFIIGIGLTGVILGESGKQVVKEAVGPVVSAVKEIAKK